MIYGKRLFTVKDPTALFQRDDETMRRWLREGDMSPNAFQVKGGWYMPANDVMKMIKNRSDQ